MMLQRTLFLLVSLIGLFLPISASPIFEMIKKGEIEEARREISEHSTAIRRDGDLLFFQALIEESGMSSFQFLEASVRAGLSAEYLEQNTYLMALYYMAEGDIQKLATTTAAYLQSWEGGKYRPEMLRFAAYGNYQTGKKENSNKLLGNLIGENKGSSIGETGLLDRARNLYIKKAYVDAQKICRQLANGQSDDVIAPALYMLSYYAIEQKRIDEAVLYYNLLKEGYPDAIGLDDLVDKFTKIENRKTNQAAENITGTFYSIQVGVFSVRNNAVELSKTMKKYGKAVEIEEKNISDKKYFVVYIGRFSSTEGALSFKEQFEKSENEVFRIVAR
jgi:hypothetical protein